MQLVRSNEIKIVCNIQYLPFKPLYSFANGELLCENSGFTAWKHIKLLYLQES
jgi:hypothetical protein